MLNYQLNAQRDFTPAAVAPPKAINPEQVILHHAKRRGSMGGTGTVPSFIIPVLRISCFSKKELP